MNSSSKKNYPIGSRNYSNWRTRKEDSISIYYHYANWAV